LETEKPAYMQVQEDRNTGPRQIGHCPVVGAMNADREAAAVWTRDLVSCGGEVKLNVVVVGRETSQAEARGSR